MQIIISVNLPVEQYVKQEYHRRIRRPNRCGVCGKAGALKPQGYYDRDTTGATGDLVRFKVARFICRGCRRTTSCLPSFAQPYRLVGSETIGAFINGDTERRDVQRAAGLLKTYWKRYAGWHKRLARTVGNLFGRSPPKETATAFLRRAVAACGTLAELTVRLVQAFRITCFGIYRCHQTPSTSN